jgi:propionate catabolism operon transcriptional regulator
MPLNLQTRLLRVLEEKEIVRVGGVRPISVDVRIISATHCDLQQRIRDDRFRADLFFRLAILPLHLPSLRERPEDLVSLSQWSLKQACAAIASRPHPNLHAEVARCEDLLRSYSWPGNVRELRNFMERVALHLSATPLQAITPGFLIKLLPELAQNDASELSAAKIAETSEESLDFLMHKFKNRKDDVAKYLGISRTTLWRKLKNEKTI